MHAARRITRALALAMLACATLCAAVLYTVPAHAAETPDATSIADPSTANDYGDILGEGEPNTLNSGRIWADKSVYTEDAELDGVTVANDGDFLIVFSALGSSIATSGPGLSGTPTSPIAGANDALTFTDPLGQYMEPTGDVTLVQFGQSYRFTRTGSTGDAMTFAPVADQTIVNQSYGVANVTFSLSDISIMAKRDAAAGNWTMNIRIPANALPLNVATIVFGAADAQGNRQPVRFESNAGTTAALPVRVAYAIGVSESVKGAGGELDFTKVAPEYQKGHVVTTGTGAALSFDANYYDDPTSAIDPNATRGNAVVSFDPAPTNCFYYFQERHTVYRNGTPGTYIGNPVNAGKVSGTVTDLYELQGNPRKTFYVVKEYFRRTGTGGAHVAYEVIAYTGEELASSVGYFDPKTQAEASGPAPGVVIATKVGGACLGSLKAFRTAKAGNPTNTAALSYVGSYVPDASAYGGYTLQANYGNNGVLTIPYAASSVLDITGLKRFDINGGVWAPGTADFHSMRFDVLPSRSNPAGDPVGDAGFGVISNASGEINLSFGPYLQPGTYSYVVRERMPASPIAGMTYDSSVYIIVIEARPGYDGKIATTVTLMKNGTPLASGQRIEFVNSYDTAAVGVNVQGSKRLDGATLGTGMFSFVIEAIRGTGVGADGTVGPIACPLPSQTTVACDDAGAFAFPTISFGQAGEFVYRVRELATRPNDYSYDGNSYLVTIIVRHTGTGPLRAEMTIAKVSEDGTTAPASVIAFRNSVIPPALVIDKSQSVNGTPANDATEVKAGDTIVYRIELRNPSGIAAHNVLLYDEVPAGLLLADFAAGANGPYLHDDKLYWIIDELAAGASYVVEFAVLVPIAPDNTTWHNQAQAAYPNPLNDDVLSAQSTALTARYVAEPQPAPGPDPEPGPGPEPQPEPGPGPEPSPEPEPDPTPVPTPGPEPGPAPSIDGNSQQTDDAGVASQDAPVVSQQTDTGDAMTWWACTLIALLALMGAVVFRRLRYQLNDWRDHDSRDH